MSKFQPLALVLLLSFYLAPMRAMEKPSTKQENFSALFNAQVPTELIFRILNIQSEKDKFDALTSAGISNAEALSILKINLEADKQVLDIERKTAQIDKEIADIQRSTQNIHNEIHDLLMQETLRRENLKK